MGTIGGSGGTAQEDDDCVREGLEALSGASPLASYGQENAPLEWIRRGVFFALMRGEF